MSGDLFFTLVITIFINVYIVEIAARSLHGRGKRDLEAKMLTVWPLTIGCMRSAGYCQGTFYLFKIGVLWV